MGEPSRRIGLRPLKEAMALHERRLILEALDAFGWDRGATARALGLSRRTLSVKMRAHGLRGGDRRDRH